MIFAYLKIAVRNVRKNGRRSLTTILAVGLGFAALSLFDGWADGIHDGLRAQAVADEGIGHLTIHKEGWLQFGVLHPEEYMLTGADLEKIVGIASKEPGVTLVAPKLGVSGLLSNGKVSTVFIGEGIDPKHYNELLKQNPYVEPAPMDENSATGVHTGERLSEMLGIKKSDQAMLSAPTLSGSFNAVDVKIDRVFNTGLPDTDNKFVRMPLALAQELSDTQGADRVLLVLDDYKQIERVRASLKQKFQAAGIKTDIKSFDELSVQYSGTIEMLGMMQFFMLCIVVTIVVMSIINTMAVSVVERTREIGTLRALGLTRGRTGLLFAIEGIVLGGIGSLLGVLVHSVVWASIQIAHPTYMPPGNSQPVPFVIEYAPYFVTGLAVAMMTFALAAALMPARRAAAQNMVVSLGHV